MKNVCQYKDVLSFWLYILFETSVCSMICYHFIVFRSRVENCCHVVEWLLVICALCKHLPFSVHFLTFASTVSPSLHLQNPDLITDCIYWFNPFGIHHQQKKNNVFVCTFHLNTLKKVFWTKISGASYDQIMRDLYSRSESMLVLGRLCHKVK